MEEKNFTGAIPENQDGKVINAESSRSLDDVASASNLFNVSKRRLLDVNRWNEMASKLLANFQLTDQRGNEISGPAQEGYYFKIDIPGPGSDNGDGFDWAYVEKIEEFETTDVQSIAIRVRPAAKPGDDAGETAHFYTEDATSTFTVTREKYKITAAIYDRNIKVNTSGEHIFDSIRNTLVGTVGRMVFSKIQWEYLTDALIE